MSTFYKDFGKASKDLLTKSVAEGKLEKGETGFPKPIWKIESKLKAKEKCVVVNPVADAKGITANVEWTCCDALKGKINVASDIAAWKPTLSYETSGRKVEVTAKNFTEYKTAEVTYEDKQKVYSAIVKATAEKLNVEASAPVIDEVSVGASIEIPLSGEKKYNFSKWSAGVLYAPCKTANVGFSLNALDAVDVFGNADIPNFKLEDKPVSVGAVVTVQADKNFAAVIGASGKTPLCPCGSTWKLKADTYKNVSFTQIVDLSGWKISWTFDVVKRAIGFTATLE